MKRTKRRCLLISAMVHAILLGVLLVGPAFVHRQTRIPDNLPVLHVIPANIVDELVSGGGNPNAQQPAAQAPAPAPPPVQRRPEPTPPTTTPARAEPQPLREPEPKPVRQPETRPSRREQPPPEPVRVPEPSRPIAKAITPAPKPEPPKPSIKVNTNLERRAPEQPSGPTRQELERAAEQDRQRRLAAATDLSRTVRSAVQGIQKNLSGETVVDIPGPGGAAYANYRQVVKTYYDRAWISPTSVDQDEAVVRVEVVINHDGKVLSHRVLQRSGVGAVDRSVEDALDRVRLQGLPPFPEGAKDLQRAFRIKFDLKSKRLSG
jgi:TonB family protein